MHQKWKYIIANWINCYFYENNNKNETQVNHESLLNIISHLRENFNLDESKSSIFGGHSLEEFISEKYPNFKFENGTVEVTNQEEIFVAASLLLFFVCVNSKDVDIKNAMCSKLSTGDQEVILKFSKSLMECHSISSLDVIAAIAEACGSDTANGEGSHLSPMVAETPPALRSLHGEVRRLQAALDAERFDRNYLQDELARTNFKMEKLLKDKEQYKADIMDLKAKISMCCGQEAEARGDEGKSNEIVKLSRQLQQMEQRVVDVQEQLEEAQHERDTYKTKLEDLKGECERLLVLSREETTRAGQLSEELESEKSQSQTLRELVIELRQHNLRNGFDTSLLECDDPDTSVQSLQRSFSVCSEVCANVVEVQLGEERAKCLGLKQQIQSLQDNINEHVQKAEIFQKIITDRENDIFNLKHRINEEIEEKNNLKLYFENEITKLNNIVNDLEQKLKDNCKHSNLVIEKKMQDIQTLQEEKLSLLQSLSDETTKSENIMKDLKADLEKERTSKMKMRDEYENVVMKMKEKVLNRNNELVELQNNVSKNSELIEQLNLELRKERDLKNDIINKCNKDMEFCNAQKNNLEKDLQDKFAEITELVHQIHQRDSCIEELTKIKEKILTRNNELVEVQNNVLQKVELKERQNLELQKEIDCSEETIHRYQEDMEHLNAQKNDLEKDLRGKCVEITELVKQKHLRDVNIDELVKMKDNLLNKNNELVELQNNVSQKNELIEQQNLEFQKDLEQDVVIINKLKKDLELACLQKSMVEENLQGKCAEITELVKQIHQSGACINEMKEKDFNVNKELIELRNEKLQKNELVKELNLKLEKERQLKNETLHKFNIDTELLKAQKNEVEEDLQGKCKEIIELVKQIHQKDICIDQMKEKCLNENKKLAELQNSVLEKSELIEQLNLLLKQEREVNKETINRYNKDIELLQLQKIEFEETLESKNDEITKLLKQMHQHDVNIDELVKMKENLLNKNNELLELQNNVLQKNELIEQRNMELLKEMELKDEIIQKYDKDIKFLTIQKSNEENSLQNKCAKITELEKQIQQCDICIHEMNEKVLSLNNMLFELRNDILQKNELIKELNLRLEKEQQLKDETIDKYNMDIRNLNAYKNKIEEDLKAKCEEINELVKQIHKQDVRIDELKEKCLNENKKLVDMQNKVLEQSEQIDHLNLQVVKEREVNEETFNRYNKDIELLNAEKNKVEKDLLSKCEQITDLEKQIKQRDTYIDERIKDLEYFKTTTSQNNLEITEKLKHKLELITMLEEKLSDCDRNIVTLELDKVTYEKLIAQLEKEKTDLIDLNEILKTDNYTLSTQKKEFELQIETLHKDMLELTNKLITLKQENSELLSVIDQKQLDITELELQIKQIVDEKIKIRETFENEKLKYVSEYNTLQEKYSTALEELGKQNKELLNYQDIINNNNSVMKDLVKEKEVLKNEKASLMDENNCNLKKLSKLKEEIKTLTLEELPTLKETNLHLMNIVEENKVAIGKVLNRNNELVELQTNVLQKMELIEQLNLELKKEMELKDEIIHKCNKEIEALITQKGIFEKDLESKCAEMTEMARQILQREACIAEMREKDTNINNKLHELQNDVLQKTEIIDQLNLVLQNERKLREETVHKFDENIELLTIQKCRVEENLQSKCAEIAEMAKKILQREACIAEMREKDTNINKKFHELQNDVLQKTEIIDQLNLELQNERKLREETVHKFDEDIELLTIQKCRIEENLQSKCAEIAEMAKQIHQRDACIDELKEKDIIRYKELVDLQNSILQKTEQINHLDLELQKERELKDATSHKFDKDIENLNVQKSKVDAALQTKCAEITDLVQQIHQRDARIEEVMKEFENIKRSSQHDSLEVAEKLKQKLEMNSKLEEKLIDYEKNIISLEADKVDYQVLIAALEKGNKGLIDANENLISENDQVTKQNKVFELQIEALHNNLEELKDQLISLKDENSQLLSVISQNQTDITKLEQKIKEEQNEKTVMSHTFEDEKLKYVSEYKSLQEKYSTTLQEFNDQNNELSKYQDIINNNNNVIKDLEKASDESEKLLVNLKNEMMILEKEKNFLVKEKNENLVKISKLEEELKALTFEELPTLKDANLQLLAKVEENKAAISTLENVIKKGLEENESLRKEKSAEKFELIQKCNTLEENLQTIEQELIQRNTKINNLQEEIFKLKYEAAVREKELKEQNTKLSNIIEEKDSLLCKINDELSNEISLKDQYKKDAESKERDIRELQNILKDEKDAIVEALKNENKMLTKQIAQIESNAAQEMSCQLNHGRAVKNQDDLHPQVDCISSTNISNSDSKKTIRDLEIILNDKNRMITSLQIDITFLKSLMAESENKVLDLTKDLEASQENCQQLSNQLKKILHQKNEEIAELKNKMSKVSAMENRASQIIKVSAKYQEIIHKRMAEIKSNTVLKELTNFGNAANAESDLKRSLNSGTITMKDLENFLETTDRHIRRCSEKRLALQKERDRLAEVNRINESEIISVRKFLTELSVTVKTFNSVKEIYTQKLCRVVSLQRTVRREILNVEGRLTDAAVCKLERGYAATMQDLAECVMNLERWVERSIGRAISAEKIKQAFTSDNERNSLAPTTFQNASLEAQMDQLENSFQKLLEEAVRAQKGDGAKDSLAMTVQEVRAEYEEKLARMKTKMKELYQKEVQSYKEAQREEVTMLQQELQSTREKMRQSHKEYEEEIRSLTLELWNVGEKFLDKADEANWLRRKQRSESLMSLQHVPSSGLGTQTEEPGRQSDTHSLRSLPVNVNNKKREGRGLHMSDEEGEVFDNRCLRELSTPCAPRTPRLSELRWRNSLCPPHLKSSYPAETQFAPALHEEDIKAGPTNASVGGRQQRKEVGITAYKKPGPPTPSKQAGRLSATDSELRESLRVEAEPQPLPRKTSTPSRLRSLFSSSRSDNVEGTPRARRLSNFFKKK